MIKIHRSPKNIIQMVSQTVDMINNSGMTLEPGHLVIIDRTIGQSVKTSTDSYEEISWFVAISHALPGETVKCQYAGVVNVLVDTKVCDPGDFIYTSNIAGIAYPGTTGYPGAGGVALTYKPSGITGFVKVLLAGGMGETY